MAKKAGRKPVAQMPKKKPVHLQHLEIPGSTFCGGSSAHVLLAQTKAIETTCRRCTAEFEKYRAACYDHGVRTLFRLDRLARELREAVVYRLKQPGSIDPWESITPIERQAWIDGVKVLETLLRPSEPGKVVVDKAENYG
jgi:nitrogenase molybdenum-iron protein alpha/beta subunit